MLGERYLLEVAVVTVLFCVMMFTNGACHLAFTFTVEVFHMSVSRVSF